MIGKDVNQVRENYMGSTPALDGNPRTSQASACGNHQDMSEVICLLEGTRKMNSCSRNPETENGPANPRIS
jgi:hypothetical protein